MIKTKAKMFRGHLVIIVPKKYCEKIDLKRDDVVQVHINSLNSLRIVRQAERAPTKV